MVTHPYLPIIYIRGYAGTQAEVEDTVATPYMGFNLGSTKLRQLSTGEVRRHIFESPLIRLMKDHGYTDIYEGGAEIPPHREVSPRSIWIYRYYEPVSTSLGSGDRPEIEDYAEGLHSLIERVRSQVGHGAGMGGANGVKVYLVAHSMGGLVARCYLQKIWPSKHGGSPPPVDKVFTYATPHGGIDFRLAGNVPSFIRHNNIDNFNEGRMRAYLGLDGQTPVSSLTNFDSDRFFSLVGTNHQDYDAAGGLSSHLVGPMSDGLVQIKNAYVSNGPRAFVHRSHSGHYGIVNSESGYQNLSRFLFGDVRVDAKLEIDEVTYPPKVQRRINEGKNVMAAYHVEIVARVRGARWDLHRRLTGEQSAIFVDQDRITERPISLMSGFLMKAGRINTRRPSLGFSIDLGVLVPEYEIDGFMFLDDHYDGGYLYRDKINLEVSWSKNGQASVRYGFDSTTPNRTSRTASAKMIGDGKLEIRTPISSSTRPGLKGTLVLHSRPWS